MAAVATSETAMAAVTDSGTATAAVLSSSTALAAVAASTTAMAVVSASVKVMAAMAASSKAMAAVAASATAMAAVSASKIAMAAVTTSQLNTTYSVRQSAGNTPLIRDGKALVTGIQSDSEKDATYLLANTIVIAPLGMPKSSSGKRDMVDTLISVNPLRSGNSLGNVNYTYTQTVRYIAIE
jgi:hypothetical protein